jgi:hypothetical protein
MYVYESECSTPRNLELSGNCDQLHAPASTFLEAESSDPLCSRFGGSKVTGTGSLRFVPVRSGSLQLAPVRSSSLRFARAQNCPSMNQRNVKKQTDLEEGIVSPVFTSGIG